MTQGAKSQRTLLFHSLPFLGIFSEISGHPMHVAILKILSVKEWFYTPGQISCRPLGSGDTEETAVT